MAASIAVWAADDEPLPACVWLPAGGVADGVGSGRPGPRPGSGPGPGPGPLGGRATTAAMRCAAARSPIMVVSCCWAAVSSVCSCACCAPRSAACARARDLGVRARPPAPALACCLEVAGVGQGACCATASVAVACCCRTVTCVDDVGPVPTGRLEQRGALDHLARSRPTVSSACGARVGAALHVAAAGEGDGPRSRATPRSAAACAEAAAARVRLLLGRLVGGLLGLEVVERERRLAVRGVDGGLRALELGRQRRRSGW